MSRATASSGGSPSPTLLLLSLNHFLPKTSHNVSSYLGALEDAHFPSFAEKHEITKAHSAMTWERIKDASQSGRESFSGGAASVVERVEEATGLKLGETLGWRRRVEGKAEDVVKRVEDSAEAARTSVEAKSEEVKERIEEKVETSKRLL